MKTTKKPEFIVDLTKCESPESVKFEVIRAKAKAGKKLTDQELMFIVRLGAQTMTEIIDEQIEKLHPMVFETTDKKKIKKMINILVPKKPWYKRLWNWITRKK